MINQVVLVGRLTKDPELRYSQNGVAMVNYTIAVNRQFKTDGQPDVDFINCKAFKKQAENLANFQKKGNLIGLEGRIQTGSYEKDGQRVFTTDVIADSIQFLERKESGQQQAPQQQSIPAYNQESNSFSQPSSGMVVDDDDLPF